MEKINRKKVEEKFKFQLLKYINLKLIRLVYVNKINN